jgi:hypothetical protein
MLTTMADNMRWEVDGWRLRQLEQDHKDLKRAKACIKRLRAYNRALKEEQRRQRNALVACYDKHTSFAHKYGIIMAAHALGIPFSATDKKEARRC